jgi:tRNA(His) guanylyltransferase
MTFDAFSVRMKRYEEAATQVLMIRTPVIVRVDGKNFRKLTRTMKKPFDHGFATCMEAAALALAEEAQNCRMAYVQSDEISLLLTDFRTLSTSPWFDNQVQKICSISASTATAAFMKKLSAVFPSMTSALPRFDARCYNMPREEVANYFVWRQRDCERNSVAMAAQANFSHGELHGANRALMMDMLMLRKGINWNDYDAVFKRGRVITRELVRIGTDAVRTSWTAVDAPIFTQDREFIERFLREEEDRTK